MFIVCVMYNTGGCICVSIQKRSFSRRNCGSQVCSSVMAEIT